MRQAFSLGLFSIAAVLSTTVAYAETCTGKWGGVDATSIIFLSSDQLRYCYLNECWNSVFSGDKKKKIKFRVGGGQARVEMTAKGAGYAATWRSGNNSSKATLTCK